MSISSSASAQSFLSFPQSVFYHLSWPLNIVCPMFLFSKRSPTYPACCIPDLAQTSPHPTFATFQESAQPTSAAKRTRNGRRNLSSSQTPLLSGIVWPRDIPLMILSCWPLVSQSSCSGIPLSVSSVSDGSDFQPRFYKGVFPQGAGCPGPCPGGTSTGQ